MADNLHNNAIVKFDSMSVGQMFFNQKTRYPSKRKLRQKSFTSSIAEIEGWNQTLSKGFLHLKNTEGPKQ